MPHRTGKERRQRHLEDKIERPKTTLEISNTKPITINQKKVFESFYSDQHLFLYGVAGTGKSFISMYLALEQILSGLSAIDKIVIIRSAVQTRQQGFLPGKVKEKMEEYEIPYEQICTKLFNKSDAYKQLRSKHVIDFVSTSFLRSLTFDDTIIIVDECQNMTSHELDTVITRTGKNSRLIFCGDMRQVDLEEKRERSGIKDFIKIIKTMKIFDFIEFGINDIVRGPLVKNYIKTRLMLEDAGEIERL